MTLREALLYDRLENSRVSCRLCSHGCKIAPNHSGICRVRENRNGVLYTHTYGAIVAEHLDPVGKKPLYHFQPGSLSYSIAAIGCNFRCDFCQNWQISQAAEADALGVPSSAIAPAEIVARAVKSGARSISYTYTEPTLLYEFAAETGRLAVEKGLANIFVTNGFMSREMLLAARPWLHAANVDLKAFKDETYRRVCKGRLAPVLENIQTMRAEGIWVEATTLVVPGMNDSEAELTDIARFLAGVDPAMPWHISRFYPQYRMSDQPPTPVATLNKALAIAKAAGLHYAYIGNAAGQGNHTWCHQCGTRLIEREGFSILGYHLKDGSCPKCGTKMAGVEIK